MNETKCDGGREELFSYGLDTLVLLRAASCDGFVPPPDSAASFLILVAEEQVIGK